MSSIQHRSIPLHRNPALRPGLAALVEWLIEGSYSAHAIGRIFDYTAVEGTPTGCPELAPEDEYGASSVFCDGLDLVPYSADAWHFDDVFLDARMLAEGTHPFPFQLCPPDLEPEDFDGPDAPDDGPYARFPGVMPPIRGGSDEAESFQPSAEDLADYHAWSEDLDRRRAGTDRHSPDALARIHRALYGRSEPFHA